MKAGFFVLLYEVLLIDHDQSPNAMRNMDWPSQGFILTLQMDLNIERVASLDLETFSLVIINMRKNATISLELCEVIRRKSRIPIVLIGGDKDFHTVRQAMTYRVSDYLPAPYTALDLRATLRNLRAELVASPIATAIPLHSSVMNLRNKRFSDSSVIDMVKNYIQKHLHENITLKEIARIMHFNSAYLGQKFKQHTHMTFNEYLLQQRMETAKRLLIETDLRIYQIANEVGYSETDWFYKKFKAYTGKSAKEYRKKNTKCDSA